MPSINSNPTHVAKIGYNGFDMSNLLKFSSTVGELLPVYYDFLSPGDKVSLKHEMKTRTMELASPAMVHIKEHIDWFFVPFRLLWSLFPSWIYQIDDVNSSLFTSSVNTLPQRIPFYSGGGANSNAYKLVKALQTNEDYYFTSSVYVSADAQMQSLKGTSMRLFELLGMAVRPLAADSTVETQYMTFTPLLFCAYQKIYQDFYRLSDREALDNTSYSLDRFIQNSSITYNSNQFSMFRLRYRPWAKDFFTNTYKSPLFGVNSDVSYSRGGTSFPSMGDFFNQWLNTASYNTMSPSGTTANNDTPTQLQPVVATNANIAQALSPTSIRTSFALQKMLEITRRAGKHYDAQTLAHFGVSPSEAVSNEVVYIGGDVQTLSIGDVISTADTDNALLGKLAGKGYGYGTGNGHKFMAKEHGILMAIYSAEPLADYAINYFDKLNTYFNIADFYNEAFDNLGMQPLFQYQVLALTNALAPSVNNTIFDYQYRWSELKQKHNRVAGAFMRSLSYWSPCRFGYREIENYYYAANQNMEGIVKYLIRPSYLDDIMLVSYQFDTGVMNYTDDPDYEGLIGFDGIYSTDPLVHELYFDVKKASKMSTYGLESL